MLARWQVIDDNFIKRVQAQDFPNRRSELPSPLPVSAAKILDWFDSQLKSRHLDLIARVLKESGQSFYTIGSSGHESNAVLGDIFSLTDMPFLHYRSGAFFIQRSKKDKKIDPVFDLLLSLVCAEADPICSGRHKVFGSVALNVPPQTSTIASHSPKALGAAMALARAKRLQPDNPQHEGAALCVFGDASFNHSTLQGSLNAAQWLAESHYPLPLIFICEDNGIGVSTATPEHWIQSAMSGREGLHYLSADGLNLLDVYRAGCQARQLARKQQPVFLHLKVKRLMGHAGSDIEQHYWTSTQIETNESDDPLLHSARLLIDAGLQTAAEIIAHYRRVGEEVHRKAEQVQKLPKLSSQRAVMQSLLAKPVTASKPRVIPSTLRHSLWQQRHIKPCTLAQMINLALVETLAQYPQTLLFGEDVAKKGGVYRVTAELQKNFGAARVFDTLLDEQTILGMAMGFALQDFIPIPEIQFLAFLHNAADQLRGEAATLPFFSNGEFSNPMVLRLPGLAFQKGFGGHFHNDNALAFLREIPGLIIACPSNGINAVKLWRSCMQLAIKERRVVVFLEPIALYHQKDLLVDGDKKWLGLYPDESQKIALDEVIVSGDPEAKTAILTYGNGVFLAEKALRSLNNSAVKIIDLAWLLPLPEAALKRELAGVQALLIVDECRQTGSVSEQIMAWLLESNQSFSAVKRIVAADCFIPLGNSWQYLLPSVDDIVDALKLFEKGECCGRLPVTQ